MVEHQVGTFRLLEVRGDAEPRSSPVAATSLPRQHLMLGPDELAVVPSFLTPVRPSPHQAQLAYRQKIAAGDHAGAHALVPYIQPDQLSDDEVALLWTAIGARNTSDPSFATLRLVIGLAAREIARRPPPSAPPLKIADLLGAVDRDRLGDGPPIPERIRLIDWCLSLLPSIDAPEAERARARAVVSYNRALLLTWAGDRRASLKGYEQLIRESRASSDIHVRGLVHWARVNRAGAIAPTSPKYALREWNLVLDDFRRSREVTFAEPAAFAAAHIARVSEDLAISDRAALLSLARELAGASTDEWSARVMRITAPA